MEPTTRHGVNFGADKEGNGEYGGPRSNDGVYSTKEDLHRGRVA